MKVSVTGKIESIREVVKNNRKTTEIYLNQKGEMQKVKVKINGEAPDWIKVDDDATFEGRVVSGVYNGKPYEFVKVS